MTEYRQENRLYERLSELDLEVRTANVRRACLRLPKDEDRARAFELYADLIKERSMRN